MSRWLLLTCCISVLGAIAYIEPTRAANAHVLGGSCARDRDCQLGMSCVFEADVMEGQCAATCNDSAACHEQFGSESVCVGADLCARTCTQDADCAQGSQCNAFNWCEVPAPK
jgi:hypothetical protein